MRMTEKSLSALPLGSELAKFCFEGYASQYADALSENRRHLEVLGLDAALLPEDAATYRERRGAILRTVSEQLRAERARLGGDCYALPWFGLTYGSFVSLATVSVGGDAEWTTALISEALEDLGIDGPAAAIVPRIERETQWIEVTREADDQTVATKDVTAAHGRLLMQLLYMWREAERRQASRSAALDVDQSLFHPCFVLACEQDAELRDTLAKALDFHGIDIVDALNAADTAAYVIALLSANSLTDDFIRSLQAIHERRPLGESTFVVRVVPMEAVIGWRPSDSSLAAFVDALSQLLIPGIETPAQLDQTVNVLLRSLKKTRANSHA